MHYFCYLRHNWSLHICMGMNVLFSRRLTFSASTGHEHGFSSGATEAAVPLMVVACSSLVSRSDYDSHNQQEGILRQQLAWVWPLRASATAAASTSWIQNAAAWLLPYYSPSSTAAEKLAENLRRFATVWMKEEAMAQMAGLDSDGCVRRWLAGPRHHRGLSLP